MDFHQSIVGRRCRPAHVGGDKSDFYYEVVGVWLDEREDQPNALMCAVISATGGTNTVPFKDLSFEPMGN